MYIYICIKCVCVGFSYIRNVGTSSKDQQKDGSKKPALHVFGEHLSLGTSHGFTIPDGFDM